MDKKIEKFSQEDGNLNLVSASKEDNKRAKIIVGTVNILTKERKVLGRSKKLRWITDSGLIIIVAIVLLLGVSYSIRTYTIGKNVILESRVISQKVSSGNLESFELDYKNNNRETIYNTSVSLDLPSNFILDQVLPSNIFDKNTNTVNLGDLVSGANGKIKIRAYVLGAVGSQQFIKFYLNYSKDGLHRRSQNVLSYLIEDSVLNIQLNALHNLYQGVLFSAQLVLHNQGQRALDNIKIVFDKNITISKADNFQGLQFDSHNIYLNKLKNNEKISVNVDLVINNIQGQNELTIFSEANGLKQKTLKQNVFIEVPKFKVNIIPQQKQMRAGEYLDFKITYQNNEDDTVKNISLSLRPTTNFFLRNLELKDKSRFNKKDSTIYFNDALVAQEGGSLNIRALLERNKIKLNQQAGLLAEISYNYHGKNINYPSTSSKIKVCSNLNIKSAAYYYSPQGDQLGLGPIPPVVDVATNYWIFWEAENFGNNLSSFSMSADLPEGLVWTDNKSILSGNLQYGEISRRIIWTIDKLEAQDGKYKAKFEVSLIPKSEDVGKILDLLTNIKFSAQDIFCGSKISGSEENINTNLTADNLATGKSKVQSFK